MQKTILIAVPEFPYPPNHGGRVGVWNRIITLSRMGYKIDLLCTVKDRVIQDHIEEAKKYVNNLYLLKRKNRLIDMFSCLPLQVESRKSLKNGIDLQHNEYYIVLLEGDYLYHILQNKSFSYKHAALRVHNNESVYFRELAASAPWGIEKVYYYLDSIKFKHLNKLLREKIQNFMFVSYDEEKLFARKFPDFNTAFLPMCLGSMHFKNPILSQNRVLFIGSFFMMNNREGILWYINNVHSRVTQAVDGYELLIAGNSRRQSLSWLLKVTESYKNIKVVDSPEILDDLYASSSVFINPMLHGAGVKVKTIDAVVNGLPVVSTKIGAEGIGFIDKDHLCVTDDSNLFAAYVIELLRNKESGSSMVMRAQKYLEIHYDHERLLEKYFSSLR